MTGEEYIRKIQEIMAMTDVVSYDQAVVTPEGTDTTMLNLIADEYAPSPEQLAIDAYNKEQLWKLVAKLSPREQKVIKLRMGYDTYPLTLDEIGKMFGVTRERIRQIEAGALNKLKRLLQKHGWSE